ncbi:MAG: L-glyceraldehyde 3-phosphate reductase [Brachybacterium sp.]|nr:L-glyceraldehyde 3-phosphate reductase [Brachybacterium sp.]
MDPFDPYQPAEDRYASMPYRRVGTWGLKLPAISLGLWQNFGTTKDVDTQRAIIRRAVDRGVIHLDLANNYGPPPGSAETIFGRFLREDLAPWRHELIISTKAGYEMWPGPNGNGGSRKYLLDSLDQSLGRMGLDHVDIFYSHRPDEDTPLEETMMALDQAVRSGRALYAGISSYSPSLTRKAAAMMEDLGTPLLIHQPSYSMLNRWVEDTEQTGTSLLGTAAEQGLGVIAFSPLAQGLLTDKYLDGIPEDSRLRTGKAMNEDMLADEVMDRVRGLHAIAEERGQSLAQMAIAWVLRDQGPATVTSALVGASSVEQLDNSLGALKNLEFTEDELTAIDEHARDSGLNIWEWATASKS